MTNLETGQSERVTIRDRGPYVRGRVIDLSPRVASRLGMRRQGVAPVEVTPEVMPDGSPAAGTQAAGTRAASN